MEDSEDRRGYTSAKTGGSVLRGSTAWSEESDEPPLARAGGQEEDVRGEE